MEETAQSIINFVGDFKYSALFLIALVEGPIISIIVGFLVSSGVLLFVPSIIIVYLGDVISDIGFYFLGSGSRRVIRRTRFLKDPHHRIMKIDHQYATRPWRTMIVAKAAYGLGMTFMTVAGASRMTFGNFLKYIVILNAIRSGVLFAVGYYFGKTVIHFGPKYIPFYILFVIVFVVLWLVISKSAKTAENNANNLTDNQQ